MQKVFVRFNRIAVGKNAFGPDEMAMQADAGTTLSDLLTVLQNTKFLPDVRAYRVAWVALHAGKPLALMARSLGAPILFTNGKSSVLDYAGKGSPVFFMADLGRKDSRTVLESFGRKAGEGRDASEAMNDVLESYLMINRKYSALIDVSLRTRGSAGGRSFTLHGTARLSDAVYSVYRNGCLPAEPSEGPVWVLSGGRGALAVLARQWESGAEARYLPEQDTELAALFSGEESIELTLHSMGFKDPEEVYTKLKNPDGTYKFNEGLLGDDFKNRFGRLK